MDIHRGSATGSAARLICPAESLGVVEWRWHPAAAEAVSHDAGEDEPTVTLAGASADIHLNWTNHLTFTDGEQFSWRKVLSCLYVMAAKALASFW